MRRTNSYEFYNNCTRRTYMRNDVPYNVPLINCIGKLHIYRFPVNKIYDMRMRDRCVCFFSSAIWNHLKVRQNADTVVASAGHRLSTVDIIIHRRVTVWTELVIYIGAPELPSIGADIDYPSFWFNRQKRQTAYIIQRTENFRIATLFCYRSIGHR